MKVAEKYGEMGPVTMVIYSMSYVMRAKGKAIPPPWLDR